MITTVSCEYVAVGDDRSRGELCKKRLIGKVCTRLRAWQWRAAIVAEMGDASTQEVERHVGNSSTGPTLRRERHATLDMAEYRGPSYQIKERLFKTFLTQHRIQFIPVLWLYCETGIKVWKPKGTIWPQITLKKKKKKLLSHFYQYFPPAYNKNS